MAIHPKFYYMKIKIFNMKIKHGKIFKCISNQRDASLTVNLLSILHYLTLISIDMMKTSNTDFSEL